MREGRGESFPELGALQRGVWKIVQQGRRDTACSAFECGFHSFLGQTRQQFSVSFFIFALLFMLFDLEILLVYPYAVSAYNNEIYGLWVVLIFLAVLTAGFVFEIGRGALKINSRQRANLNNSKLAAMSNLNASESKSHSSLSHSEKHVSFSRQHVSSFKRAYSTNSRTPTLSSRAKLHPWFVTGFADPEGWFRVGVEKRKDQKVGWTLQGWTSVPACFTWTGSSYSLFSFYM